MAVVKCPKCGGDDTEKSRYPSLEAAQLAFPCSCVLEPRTAAQAEAERGSKAKAFPWLGGQTIYDKHGQNLFGPPVIGTIPPVPSMTQEQAEVWAMRGLDRHLWEHPEYQAMLRNLADTQARCTALETEVRLLRRRGDKESAFLNAPDRPFLRLRAGEDIGEDEDLEVDLRTGTVTAMRYSPPRGTGESLAHKSAFPPPTIAPLTHVLPSSVLTPGMHGKPPKGSRSKFAVGSVAWLEAREKDMADQKAKVTK